jgi:hypothetical protein
MFGPEYIRYPTQVGDTGIVLPIDVYIGGVIGIGGTATLTQPGNLSSLVFFPIGRRDFSRTDDVNALVLYGPDGVIMRNVAKTNTVTVGPAGIAMTDSNGNSIAMAGSGITLNQTVIAS